MSPKKLFDLYSEEIRPLIGTRLDYYDDGGAMRSGKLAGVKRIKKQIVYLVKTWDGVNKVGQDKLRKGAL